MYRQSEKNLLSSNLSSTCPCNMANFRPLAAEIISLVWGTPANFNGFRVLAALLHGTLLVGVSQTLQRWTEGATYIRQGSHHIWHWPAFQSVYLISYIAVWQSTVYLRLYCSYVARSHCCCIWTVHLCVQESETLFQVHVAVAWNSSDGARSLEPV